MPKWGRGSGEKGFGGNVNVAILGKGEVEEESKRINLDGIKVHSSTPTRWFPVAWMSGHTSLWRCLGFS